MFLGTSVICNKIISIEIGQRVYSDHVPVNMKWKCTKEIIKSSSWHLNNNILETRGCERRNGGKDMKFFLR